MKSVRPFLIGTGIGLSFAVMIGVITLAGQGCRGTSVEPTTPYAWFDEAADKLERMAQNATSYDAIVATVLAQFPQNPAKMSLAQREQIAVYDQELGELWGAYNSLAAEYNARMAETDYHWAEGNNEGGAPLPAQFPIARERKLDSR